MRALMYWMRLMRMDGKRSFLVFRVLTSREKAASLQMTVMTRKRAPHCSVRLRCFSSQNRHHQTSAFLDLELLHISLSLISTNRMYQAASDDCLYCRPRTTPERPELWDHFLGVSTASLSGIPSTSSIMASVSAFLSSPVASNSSLIHSISVFIERALDRPFSGGDLQIVLQTCVWGPDLAASEGILCPQPSKFEATPYILRSIISAPPESATL